MASSPTRFGIADSVFVPPVASALRSTGSVRRCGARERRKIRLGRNQCRSVGGSSSMKHGSAPSVIELFAGAGLLSEAFRQVGYHIVAAYELDKLACESYARNIGNHIECADLSALRPKGACDVLVAGPPCQGFSTLGKRDPNDPRNAMSLVVPRWAKKVRPKVIVVENVAAFAETPVHDELVTTLESLNYSTTTVVLDAADHGASQFRLRSFTIAARTGIASLKIRRRRGGSVRTAWQGINRGADDRTMSYAPIPSPLALSRFQATPPGGDKRSIMETAPHLATRSWWAAPDAVTDVWGRMHWDAPSNTIRTTFQNPSKGRYVHPDENRVITLREGARLQGVPDDWRFHGSPTQIARQIGNGVPVPLGRAVARAVLTLV
jgi:DNA-methyltransferase (dcm)